MSRSISFYPFLILGFPVKNCTRGTFFFILFFLFHHAKFFLVMFRQSNIIVKCGKHRPFGGATPRCSRDCFINMFVYSLIHYVILLFLMFKTLSIPNCMSWGAEMLRECSPPTMCNISGVKSQVSCVTCQVSGVRCQFFFVFFLQSGGASLWSVCYQHGLPCLV